MSDHTVGTCSECGGRVTIPSVWYAVVPPTPTCASCGAMPADPAYGPVIPMTKRPPLRTEVHRFTSAGNPDDSGTHKL
jgi:hypothetical protein